MGVGKCAWGVVHVCLKTIYFHIAVQLMYYYNVFFGMTKQKNFTICTSYIASSKQSLT